MSSSILDFLTQTKEYVKLGTVVERVSDGLFRVRIGSNTLPVKSAVDRAIDVGSRVIVAQNNDNRYIVGVYNRRSMNRKEVLVDG